MVKEEKMTASKVILFSRWQMYIKHLSSLSKDLISDPLTDSQIVLDKTLDTEI